MHELKDNLGMINKELVKYQELKKTYEAKKDHYVKTLNELTGAK